MNNEFWRPGEIVLRLTANRPQLLTAAVRLSRKQNVPLVIEYHGKRISHGELHLEEPVPWHLLSSRVYYALRRVGIRYLHQLQLTPATMLLQGRGIGEKAIEEIERMMAAKGTRLPPL